MKVTFGGKVVADTRKALTLQEASYPPVLYIPRADVDSSLLTRTTNSTHCPYKGDASYYSINAGRQDIGKRDLELRGAQVRHDRNCRLRRILSKPRVDVDRGTAGLDNGVCLGYGQTVAGSTRRQRA